MKHPFSAAVSSAATSACAVLTVLVLSACTGSDDSPAVSSDAEITSEQNWPAVNGSELPADTSPDLAGPRDATCPYLDGGMVEELTGERWTGTSLDTRFETPTCVYWSYEEVPQAVVQVRWMTTHQDAVAVVNWAAPVDTTTKALQPEGWSGGRGGTSDSEYGVPGGGAVYSVFKDNIAVTVTTAQDQSVKAQKIAEQSITNLGL
jgi:UPF0176 protein